MLRLPQRIGFLEAPHHNCSRQWRLEDECGRTNNTNRAKEGYFQEQIENPEGAD